MLRIEELVKSFEGDVGGRLWRRKHGKGEQPARVLAVDGISFDVEDGQLFTLLGPSGCGKTTTLRSIAGLEKPDGGTIQLDDRVLFSRKDRRVVNVAANQRGLGMVFQSYAIWPHMTVFDNAAFPLQVASRRERLGRRDIADKVMRVLEVMELHNLADRAATKLSGGQQQRLALARAIVTEPPLLLLDEPLSNLDAKLRESLRFELKRLQRDLGITSIYVTHDQIEALALSSKVAVMNEGKIEQLGRPREIYENPRSRFVAEFIGTSNFITGVVADRRGDCFTVETSEGRLLVNGDAELATGSDVVVSIRPEAVEIATDRWDGSVPNVWSGTVNNRAFLGDSVDHVVGIGKYNIRNRSNPSVSIPPGTDVFLHMDPAKLSLVPLEA
jgi:iron(III) transport system ATP-binding protein